MHKSPSFVRAYKRYVRQLSERQFIEVCQRLKLFEKNWRNPKLHTHKLKNTKNKWAFTVLQDASRSDRLVFVFAIKDKEIWLLNIGSHDVVYGNL